MAKKSFNYDDESTKKRAKAESSRGDTGGGYSYMKLDPFKTKILILPPTPGSKSGVFKKVMIHEIRKGMKVVKRATCARAHDEECPVCQYGFDLKKRIDAKVEKGGKVGQKEMDSWRVFMPSKSTYVNAIKLEEGKKSKPVADKSVQVLRLPEGAYQELLEKLDETDKVEKVCGLDRGTPLVLKANGKSNLARKYTNFAWEGKANLIKDGEFESEEAVINDMVDLDKLEPEFSVKALEKLLRELKGSSGSSKSDDEDEDDDAVVDGDEDDEDSDFEDDDDKDEDDESDDDSDDDSDEDDSDDDDDQEDDEDDDSDDGDDDDSDDEEEDEDSDDEDDEDDEEDEKPAKKKPLKGSNKKSAPKKKLGKGKK